MQGVASSTGVGGFLPDGPDLAFWRCGRVNGYSGLIFSPP